MHDTQSLLTIILESIFVGFGIVIPILSLIRTSNLKTIEVKDLFILTAVQMVRINGILFFLLWLSKDGISRGIADIKQGDYYFYSSAMYLVISQLFWFKKLYHKKAALIVLGILLLVVPSKYFYLLLVFDHVSGWLVVKQMVVGVLLSVIVFTFLTITILLLGGKLRRKHN